MNIIEDIKALQSQAQNKNNQQQNPQSNIEMLKAQLRFVCDKIEETLIQALTPQKEKEPKEEEEHIPRIEDHYPIGQKINYYKELSLQSKYKLETIYNINKLDSLESEVKAKRDQLKEIKTENTTLLQMNDNQQKGMKEFEEKYNSKLEVMQLTDKLKGQKEEAKITKDYMKGLDTQVKGQLSQISVLQEKCQIIRENIEYRKKQQMKEVQSLIDDQKEGMDMTSLEQQKTEIESQVLLEERAYKAEVANQMESIERLKSDVDIVIARMKQMEQSKRINELKQKELNKINQRDSKKASKQTERSEGKELKMMKMKLNKKKEKEKEEISSMSRTPHIKMSNKLMKKPFEIHKFNNDTNYSDKKPQEYGDNEMMKEIESLKNEIQNVIKLNNAHLAQIPSIPVPKEKSIINKMNEQSAILPCDVESNHLEVKNEDFEYLRDIEAEDNTLIEETNKHKPFLAINFNGIK